MHPPHFEWLEKVYDFSQVGVAIVVFLIGKQNGSSPFRNKKKITQMLVVIGVK